MLRRKLSVSVLLYIFAAFLLSSFGTSGFCRDEIRERFPLVHSSQLLLVLTDSWGSTRGEAQTFERDQLGKPWIPVGLKTPVSVGRSGLGWGSGLHGLSGNSGPIKQEGDGRAPAGVFRISAVFGRDPGGAGAFPHFPYVPVDSWTECVDDIDSPYYNFILNRQRVLEADWKSSELMLREDDLYKWGAVVEHNPMPRMKRRGSCIFLHIWEGPTIPTSGCTAFDEADLVRILQWLRIDAHPLLVQLPKSEYLRWRKPWQLP